MSIDYLEEGHSGTVPHGAVLYFGLLRQVIRRVDWRVHSLHGEESSQVCSVRGDYNQCEEPPYPTNYPRRESLGHQFRSCMKTI